MNRRASPDTGPMRILGIDPGTRVMGYGVLERRGNATRRIAHGVIRLGGTLPSRLDRAYRDVQRLIREHAPEVLAIEDVFHGKNFQSVVKLAQARGVVLLAAHQGGLRIFEYSPAEVKKTATGNGNADKTQVQRMMERVLRLDETPEPTDVSDALAVAFCCAESVSRERRGTARTGVVRRRKRRPGATTAASGSRNERALYARLLRSGRARVVGKNGAAQAAAGEAGKDSTRKEQRD